MSSSQPQYIEDQNIDENEYSDIERQQENRNNNYKKNHLRSDAESHDDRNYNNRTYEKNIDSDRHNNHDQQQSSSNNPNDNDINHSSTPTQQQQQQQQLQLTQQQKLQHQILQSALQLETPTPYQNQLTMELFDKLKDFEYASRNKTGEDLITIRIQQLVINKLLVMNYDRSEYRLVLAHYHLGQAYLKNQCVEQAIQHISLALHKIQKLFETLPDARLLQIYMQNELAASLIKKENYEDAIELLNSSIIEETKLREQRREQFEERTEKNTAALLLLSQCYTKINEYSTALKVMDEVVTITRNKKMAKQQYAFALVQKAKILALQQNFTQAITYQQEAIEILMEQNYSKPEEVAQMYTTLSGYHQELGNVQNSLTCIQKVKTLYQELYSAQDKRVIKARRKIATYLLKSQRFKEAVNELLEVVELEEKVFGQNSLQAARTLKLLGAVYISMEVGDARAYLKRAMNIFSSHGNKKQVQQIKSKLKMLMTGQRNNELDTKILSQHEI